MSKVAHLPVAENHRTMESVLGDARRMLEGGRLRSVVVLGAVEGEGDGFLFLHSSQ